MNRTKKLILSATLLALSIVLSHFLSLKTPIVKISFGFFTNHAGRPLARSEMDFCY